MTRAYIVQSILIALAIILGLGLIAEHQEHTGRYHIAVSGTGGVVYRLDSETGAIALCEPADNGGAVGVTCGTESTPAVPKK